MILRYLLFISLLAISPISLALGAEIRLSHDEIKSYLEGKTVSHRPGGKTEFRQVFNANGTTTYKAAGRKAEHGKWSVQGNQYCSQWGPFGWTCYDMVAEGNLITWIAKEGTRFPGMIITD